MNIKIFSYRIYSKQIFTLAGSAGFVIVFAASAPGLVIVGPFLIVADDTADGAGFG